MSNVKDLSVGISFKQLQICFQFGSSMGGTISMRSIGPRKNGLYAVEICMLQMAVHWTFGITVRKDGKIRPPRKWKMLSLYRISRVSEWLWSLSVVLKLRNKRLLTSTDMWATTHASFDLPLLLVLIRFYCRNKCAATAGTGRLCHHIDGVLFAVAFIRVYL